jgi:hypothetical protein
MTPTLARALAARGIITVGTTLQVAGRSLTIACQLIMGKADSCIVLRTMMRDPLLCFETLDPRGKIRTISPEEIEKVDGMEILRLASSHCLTPDGIAIVLAPRGRPKRAVLL